MENKVTMAILDSDTINAFANPTGHIFLTRGLYTRPITTSQDRKDLKD